MAQPGYFMAISKILKLPLSRLCESVYFPEPHFYRTKLEPLGGSIFRDVDKTAFRFVLKVSK
jgi:hypothetical protein